MDKSIFVWAIILTFIAFVFVIKMENKKCSQVGEVSGYESKYKILSGCYLNIDDKFVNTEFIRDVNISN